MYGLFLCLRYLRSRVIAYFAVLGVALCVAMMLIVVSVMNGFLDRVEQAAKGLFGDIVIEAGSAGVGMYDEFIDEMLQKVPQVHSASPFIQTYGILQVPGTSYRQVVTIAGVRLPGREQVSDFAEGLWVQKGVEGPSFNPPVELMLRSVNQEIQQIRSMLDKDFPLDGPSPQGAQAHLRRRLLTALSYHESSKAGLERRAVVLDEINNLEHQLQKAYEQSGGEPAKQTIALEDRLGELKELAGIVADDYHIIMGLGIDGLCFRSPQGRTFRYILPGDRVTLTIVPMGRQIATNVSPTTATFMIVDDCRTDVASIDSSIVYVPFDTLQVLNEMAEELDADDPSEVVTPARTRQIHVKVADEIIGERKLQEVRAQIEQVWLDFQSRHPELLTTPLEVRTWRQQQAQVVEPIQTQRTLTVIMFGIISLVSVVLIFVIFYMIVFQKTRDIGVLKAIGASNAGVCGIFLAYGAAVGLIGSILGTVGGYYFVRYINPIQDAVDRWFGFRVWSREVFMFEMIPNEVKPEPAVLIVIGAIVAGLLGALIPAIRAGRMQPVEALRYE